MKSDIASIIESNTAGFATMKAVTTTLHALAVMLVMLSVASPAAWAQGLPLRTCPNGTRAALCQGDIIIADPSAGRNSLGQINGNGALFLVTPDPTTGVGVQTLISQGNLLTETVGVVVEANGNLVVTDRVNGVIRVDPATGAQTLLSSGGPSSDFFGIARAADGNFIVTDSGLDFFRGVNRPGRVLKIDATTGVQSIITQGDKIVHPYGVAIDPLDSSIVISDMSSFNNQGAILRVPPSGAAIQTVVWGPSGTGGVTQSAPFNCPISFESTGFQWLVISGANAQFKGSGTVNGAGSYTFLITVVDGDQVGGDGIDKYRFKLVDNSTGQVVYDNVMGASDDPDLANPQPIVSGGKIVIFLNTPPVISSLSLSSNAINEGDPITLSGSFADPDAQNHTVTINWGDGTAGTKVSFSAGTSGSFYPTHKYKDNNPSSTPRDTFTIQVTVTDGFGATGSDTRTITVANLPTQIGTVTKPSAAVLLGTAVGTPKIPIKANFTDPGTLDKHDCRLDWGNGQTSTGSVTENNGSGSCIPSQPYTYPLNGTYNVTIAVTDIKDPDTATYSFSLVINAPPVLGILSLNSASINENDVVVTTLSGTFTDADVSDTHKVIIDWGDGSGNSSISLAAGTFQFSATHRYLDNPAGLPSGAYTINVTLTDNLGGTATGSSSITVKNVAPVIIGGTGPNATLPLWIDFSDMGTLDTHQCVLTWGDGQTSPGAVNEGSGLGTCTGSHAYTGSGTYTIGITITDKDGGSVSANFPLVVK